MSFGKESEFEKALIDILSNKGWETEVLKYPTEEDLIKNWAKILFDNNNTIDRLNGFPLTNGEMQQIIEQINKLKTPINLNGFINGKTVSIKRDNEKDTLHFGKEISLKIYDRKEIAAGQSRYQIVSQPEYKRKNNMLKDRRGDLILLINGMPVIHIELKRSGVPVSEAYNQIQKYSHENVFTGIHSLVQIFVAMTPEETLYFANPGSAEKFNSNFFFHWADINNNPINNWKDIAEKLLSIPMAHQLIGFYTVADKSDDVLKVMRSYQYYAANAISDTVAKTKWDSEKQLGGFIWHTTGSGKTMTSFKSAQLIASSGDADKVVFLTDRIELGTQSLKEYRSFAEERESVQATENTHELISRLKSSDGSNTLIVTSIQKMSNIKNEAEGLNQKDIELMNKKRIVFIVDEAHRSTFGEMLITIKETFPRAIFFGFTGTPIKEENQKNMNTTTSVFGRELHNYTIADGMRDKNVLGFDQTPVSTFDEKDMREQIGLHKAKAKNRDEIYADEKKAEIFYKYMNMPMEEIEKELPKSQYKCEEHRRRVVEDIKNNWQLLSYNNKFHAIFATSSISEAIEYYRLIKVMIPELKITCIFDSNIDNNGEAIKKEEALIEILKDYNKNFKANYGLNDYPKFKKDVALRLAHKEVHKRISQKEQLDLLIVVDQMLTGFDSKWINTLYMDKILEHANLIQAFSRTNRLFGKEKPFGIIRYYRKPHTMKKNIKEAVKLYSGDKPVELFVDKLGGNLKSLNRIFEEIKEVFYLENIFDFEKLPEDNRLKAKFAKLFNKMDEYLEAARIQRFKWEQREYSFKDEETGIEEKIELAFDKTIYNILRQRYRELERVKIGSSGDVPFEIKGDLVEMGADKIDSDYMESRFEKYLKDLSCGNPQIIEKVRGELHKSFALLSQEEQKYANIILHDIERGELQIEEGKTLREYITGYCQNAKNKEIVVFAETFGLNVELLRKMMGLNLNEANLNEFNRFDNLKKTVDRAKAKKYFDEKKEKVPPHLLGLRIGRILRDFILLGGFEI